MNFRLISITTFVPLLVLAACQGESVADGSSNKVATQATDIDRSRGYFESYEELSGYCMQVGVAINEANPDYDDAEDFDSVWYVWRSNLIEAVEGDTEKTAYFSFGGMAIRDCKYDPDAPDRIAHYEACNWDEVKYTADQFQSLGERCLELNTDKTSLTYPAYVDALFPLLENK